MTNGWCSKREPTHQGQYDHLRREDCNDFVTEDEHLAQLRSEIDWEATHTWPCGATDQAAAYVAEYRPY